MDRKTEKPIAKNYFGSNEQPVWDRWAQSRRRDEQPTLEALFGSGRKPALCWGLDVEQLKSFNLHCLSRTGGENHYDSPIDWEKIQELQKRLQETDASNRQAFLVEQARELVFLAQLLEPQRTRFQADEWIHVFDQLVDVAQHHDLYVNRFPLESQYLAIELPLTLAFVLGQVFEGVESVPKWLGRSMETLLDSCGIFEASVKQHAFTLVGIWTRCRSLMSGLELEFESDDDNIQFEWLIRQSLKNLRPNRTPILGPDDSNIWSRRLFKSAIDWSRDPRDHELFLNVADKKPGAAKIGFDLEEVGVCSETSQFALLLNQVGHQTPRAAIDFSQAATPIEIFNERNLVTSTGETTILVNETEQGATGPWRCNLWHQDEDVELLELELPLNDAVIQRSMLLCKEDRLLLFADAILLKEPGIISYEMAWRPGGSNRFLLESETNEVYIEESKRFCGLVIPLFCEEWQSRWSRKMWTVNSTDARVQYSAQGSAAFIPVLIDLKSKRTNLPRTWRKLTVAERLECCPPDRADGYRVRVGDQQWLFYRSLSQPSNRTVLGQNFACEFYAGRFESDGNTHELITVE